MRNNQHKPTARKSEKLTNFVAAPKGMAYPMAPIRWSQVEKIRQLLKLLADANDDLAPMERETTHAGIDALSPVELRQVLKANGFTRVNRKVLHVTRANATILPGTGVRPSKATDEGGAPSVVFFTELA